MKHLACAPVCLHGFKNIIIGTKVLRLSPERNKGHPLLLAIAPANALVAGFIVCPNSLVFGVLLTGHMAQIYKTIVPAVSIDVINFTGWP